jgi:predicted small metal-binding protein
MSMLSAHSASGRSDLNHFPKEIVMSKVIYCDKVNPSSECDHVIRGESEEEVLRKAGDHAKEHGLEATPELIEKVRASIEDE